MSNWRTNVKKQESFLRVKRDKHLDCQKLFPFMKQEKIQTIKEKIAWLLDQVHKDQAKERDIIEEVHESHRKSAANLINYLSLRSFDIRKLQRKLGYLGMSRLARAEAHVEASLKTTLFFLNHLLGEKEVFSTKYTISIKGSEKKLLRNTEDLFGAAPQNRRLRIMVTMPTEAEDNYQLVEQMIANGMNCARINCAHDTPAQWLKMIENIKKASRKLNKIVTITMDVAGPKIRTGELRSGPKVKHFSPLRNELGKVITPAVITLVPDNKVVLEEGELPVPKQWLFQCKPGDKIRFTDTRNESGEFKVVEVADEEVIINSYKSVYLGTGTKLTASHGDGIIGDLPPLEQSIFLKNNDELILHKKPVKGCPAQNDKDGNLRQIAFLSCTLPEALDGVMVGDPVYFDDGKIRGIVEQKDNHMLKIKIIQAKSEGTKLKADKGINFPESDLKISGLTDKDKEDLKFIAKYADAVNFSFVNGPSDVQDILKELDKLQAKDKLGIILKIETQKGYDNLTKILLEAMKTQRIGVMIARGDLAIEAGWKRMGSIQKEMLAICNASHVPVVWATQVLENLAKKGLPSRSEITDAVNATRAECVMLNKGPHIIEALQLLDQLIESSEMYQDKNAPMLPKLKKISKK